MKRTKLKENKKTGLALQILKELEKGVINIVNDYINPTYNPYYNLWNLRYKGFSYKYFRETLHRIDKSGMIREKPIGPAVRIRITGKGQNFLKKHELDDLELDKSQKWDGLWRAVSFDIPERLRPLRNIFRAKLKSLGFVQVQKSLWVTKHQCRKEIAFLVKYYKIDYYVALFEGNYLGDDSKLKKVAG